MNLRISEARPEEAALVYEIMREAFAEYTGTLEPPSGANSETLTDVETAMTKGGAILARLEGEETAVGSARYELRPGYLYAGRVSVRPTYRGKGVGSAMMRYLEEIARRHNLFQIQVNVRMSLPSNVALYRALGFEIVRIEPHSKGPQTVATLVKDLSEKLFEQIHSSHYQDRIDAVMASSLITRAGNYSIITAALSDPHFEVRISAVEALGKLQTSQAFEMLKPMLEDRNWLVREATVEALGEFGRAAIDLLILALSDEEITVQELAAKNLGKLGDEIVDKIIPGFKKHDSYTQIGMLLALKDIKDLRVRELTLPLVRDGSLDFELRSTAIYVLGQFEDEQVVQLLISLVKNLDYPPEIREWAVEALTRIGKDQVVEPIRSVLKDKEDRVRANAIRSLSKIKVENAEKLLLSALADPNLLVRRSAIMSLGELKSIPAVQPLLELLNKEEDIFTLERIVTALGQINTAEVVSSLSQLLVKTKDLILYKAILEVLGKIGGEQVIDLLIQQLLSRGYGSGGHDIIEILKNYSNKVLNILEKLTTSPNENWRRTSILALGYLGNPQAIKSLTMALTDDDSEIRSSAILALGQLGDIRAIPILKNLPGQNDLRFKSQIESSILTICRIQFYNYYAS
jgi:HEAT repeat protein/ribosomal protein S18 acetylase RimI-like enzyme